MRTVRTPSRWFLSSTGKTAFPAGAAPALTKGAASASLLRPTPPHRTLEKLGNLGSLPAALGRWASCPGWRRFLPARAAPPVPSKQVEKQTDFTSLVRT